MLSYNSRLAKPILMIYTLLERYFLSGGSKKINIEIGAAAPELYAFQCLCLCVCVCVLLIFNGFYVTGPQK